MKKCAIFIVLFIFVSINSVFPETETKKYSRGSVTIEYSEFKQSEKTPAEIQTLKECGDCPGIDGYLPETTTRGMWVKVGADIVDIPISLTKDLYNLSIGPQFTEDTFKIVENREGIIVELSGGDGTGSYRAVFDIDFRRMRVKRSIYQNPDNDNPTVSEMEIKYKGKQP